RTAPPGDYTTTPTASFSMWLQCDGSGNNCTAISGATKQSYVLLAGDVGHTIAVSEIASNEGGSSGPASSAATAVVVPPPPTNKAAPSISGTAQEGQTLTETHGEWSNNPTSYAYQWQQCDGSGGSCQAISGATSQTYVLLT